MIIRHIQLKSHTNMRNIQVCHDVSTLFFDRDRSTGARFTKLFMTELIHKT